MEKPLVSVGIPCYNRPEGLRRTLECITGQTYKNLEIIVSDNCSPDQEVERVGRDFASKDSRIQYYRQKENIGTMPNFQFVLEKTTGEYFMWAADDDEWQPKYIETILNNIGNAGSCFTDYIYRNRFKNYEIRYNVPSISPEKSTYINSILFLKNLTPSMIYGLHRTETIRWVSKSEFFDFWDCFFCLRQIIEHGYNIVHSPLYIAGVDTEEYIKKPYYPKEGQVFVYKPFFKSSLKCIMSTKKFTITQKLSALYVLTSVTSGLFISHEKDEQLLKTSLMRLFLSCLKPMTLFLKN
ncbi:glycosyltransferase family 2 protein [Methanosarcina sp. UBA5]|uniref:glycosyltransferase family 2 protein n=1 Tax=Methanosarcina sp. UBA5 TaxID=1915593 RepID=UPI0025D0730A|nr:glycosyltransferase family 2 protein [Methanosarcina sp. UBA5]